MNPFDGDGRVMVDPIDPPEGTRPSRVTKACARRIVDSFMETGSSVHSSSGATLWVILAHCRANGISAQVEHQINGYFVTKT